MQFKAINLLNHKIKILYYLKMMKKYLYILFSNHTKIIGNILIKLSNKLQVTI